MNKKTLPIVIAAAVVAVALIAGLYYWKTKIQKATEAPKSAAQQAAEDVQKTAASVSTDIGKSVSPDVTTPTVNVPDTNANPYEKTNPFSDLKTNPFQ